MYLYNSECFGMSWYKSMVLVKTKKKKGRVSLTSPVKQKDN